MGKKRVLERDSTEEGWQIDFISDAGLFNECCPPAELGSEEPECPEYLVTSTVGVGRKNGIYLFEVA